METLLLLAENIFFIIVFIIKLALFSLFGENNSVLIIPSPFIYSFSSVGVLQEAPSALESTSPYFWLSSGGEFFINGGTGGTIQGSLASGNKWRLLYSVTNPLDTDSGYHPQNIFRLVTKSSWNNFSEQADFFITKDELSASPNRNQSNGLLFMSRYENSQTLYYAGIRVDGTAVIKKKYQGTYYTMAQTKVFPGTWNATSNPNLLPHNEWISLKLTTVTNTDGSVTLIYYMKRENQTQWTQLIKVTDTGKNTGGTPPITGVFQAGIRTDFMDVDFDNYRIENI